MATASEALDPTVRRAERARRRARAIPWLPLISAWGALCIVALMLLFVAYMTFVPGLPTDGGWTLQNWAELGKSHFLTRVLPNTILLGVGSMAIAGAFGLPLSWLLNRTDIPFRNTLTTGMAVMLVMPGYVRAMGWVLLLDPQIGLINNAFDAIFNVRVPISISGNIWGITWVIGLMLAPAIFFLVAGPIRSLDPVLQEAARMSGANPHRTFRRIDLPLIWPSILGALIYVVITAVSVFEIPALLGGGAGKVPVMATELFYAIRPAGPMAGAFHYGVAGVYGLALAIPCVVAMVFYLRMLDRSESYQVITGKGYRPTRVRLGKWRWVGFEFAATYFAMALILPLIVLLYSSFLPLLQMPSMRVLSQMSLDNYRHVLIAVGGMHVLQNTAVLVMCVSLLVIFFSVMISWIVVRTRLPYRKTMDMLVMMPHAVPGLAFAFALGMLGVLAGAYLPWASLSGTVAIIVIAHVIVRLPYGTRMGNAAFAQIHHELEEAAEMSGAGNGIRMRRISDPPDQADARLSGRMDGATVASGSLGSGLFEWTAQRRAFRRDLSAVARRQDGRGIGGDGCRHLLYRCVELADPQDDQS